MHRGELEDEQETQKRIVLMLLRLAVLTEALCFQPLPVRLLVLWLLRPAEAFVRAVAIEEAGGALALPPAVVGRAYGDGCAEALRLARCFRALAAFYGGLRNSGGWRLFQRRPNKRFSQCAPAMAWRSHATAARYAMAFSTTGLIDTS